MKWPFRDEETINHKLELLRLRDEIRKASDELVTSIKSRGGDVIAARDDPEIQSIRARLCRLHKKAMVSCAYDPVDRDVERICDGLTQSQVCVKALQLSEELTCCSRFMRTMT